MAEPVLLVIGVVLWEADSWRTASDRGELEIFGVVGVKSSRCKSGDEDRGTNGLYAALLRVREFDWEGEIMELSANFGLVFVPSGRREGFTTNFLDGEN